MKLSFYGADQCVTGSCHCLEVNGRKILIDCGLQQGRDEIDNGALPFHPGSIDFVLITHAHIDHTGRVPMLVKQGFQGRILTTRLTANLMDIMLQDSAYIQESDAEWKNRKAERSGAPKVEPLYTVEDAENVKQYVTTCEYGQDVELCEGVSVRFADAGHLLGSACITVTATENGVTKKLIFSGDLGNVDQPIIRDPSHFAGADYVVMESTYGNRNHTEVWSYTDDLAKIIDETMARGGNVVIPAFAVGRTQEMLYLIREVKEQGLVQGDFQVYVDSPLAVEATHVFKQNMVECYDEETKALVERGINPIDFPGLKLSVTSEESKNINFDMTPKVIISAAGMCDAGRIRHHLKHNLWREECSVVFAGYQAEGTLGRLLQDGAPAVKIFGEEIDVKAHIETLDGISGHADRDGLLTWAAAFEQKPKYVFVVHGNDESCESLTDALNTQLGLTAKAPYSGSEFDLIKGVWIKETEPVPVEAETQATRKATGVYTRLVDAGQMLMDVIARNQGGANQDLTRFTEQILALCEKWNR